MSAVDTPGHDLALPSARTPGCYRIALVCLGNICRSPMADVVLSEQLDAAGLGDRVRVRSSGTGGWHVGQPMDERAAATLTAAGHDPSRHRAQQLDAGWLDEDDLVLAMDGSNLTDITDLARPGERGDRVRLFRDFDPEPGPGAPGSTGAARDVPDPYYGGPDGFEEVLQMVERTSTALVAALQQQLGPA